MLLISCESWPSWCLSAPAQQPYRSSRSTGPTSPSVAGPVKHSRPNNLNNQLLVVTSWRRIRSSVRAKLLGFKPSQGFRSCLAGLFICPKLRYLSVQEDDGSLIFPGPPSWSIYPDSPSSAQPLPTVSIRPCLPTLSCPSLPKVALLFGRGQPGSCSCRPRHPFSLLSPLLLFYTLHAPAKMSKICDIDESGDVLVTYTGNEKDGLKVVSRSCSWTRRLHLPTLLCCSLTAALTAPRRKHIPPFPRPSSTPSCPPASPIP